MTAKRSSACDWLIAITILFCGGTATEAVAQANDSTSDGPEFSSVVFPILQVNCRAWTRVTGENAGGLRGAAFAMRVPCWLWLCRTGRRGESVSLTRMSGAIVLFAYLPVLMEYGFTLLNFYDESVPWEVVVRQVGKDGLGVIGALAVQGAEALELAENQQTIMVAIDSERTAISGVNLDEEAVALMTYQRAFQAAARYLSVVDELLGTLIQTL